MKFGKYMIFPLVFLLLIILIMGMLYLIVPETFSVFFQGVWGGLKAPVLFVLNIFGKKHALYSNQAASNLFNFGFLIGIFAWAPHHKSQIIKSK